jgi:hypothetical protein
MPVEMLTYAALGDRTEAAVRVAGRSFVYPIDWTSPHPPRGRCPRGPYHWGFGEAHHGPHRSNHPEGLRCSTSRRDQAMVAVPEQVEHTGA